MHQPSGCSTYGLNQGHVDLRNEIRMDQPWYTLGFRFSISGSIDLYTANAPNEPYVQIITAV